MVAPTYEPIECISGKDVSLEICPTSPGFLGLCKVHFLQHPKNEGDENYQFEITLTNSDNKVVNDHELVVVPSGKEK